jgi:haloalkane dehalogenase
MSNAEAPVLPDFLKKEFPFHRAAWRLEGGADFGRLIHYVDEGEKSAQPVFLVHGNPTWSFLWRKVIRRLPGSRFRCVAPDLLGLGLSEKLPLPSDHQLQRHIDAMAELFDALNLRNAILVGQDMGGPVITGIGARFPERIAGVVLGNTSVIAPKNPRGTTFHKFSHLPVLSEALFLAGNFPQNIMGVTQGKWRSMTGQVGKAYRWPLRRVWERSAPLGMARMVPNSKDHPTMAPLRAGHQWLKAFEGPLVLVWGEKDPILGHALSRHEREFNPAWVVRTDAGHFLQEEVPDALADAIAEVAQAAEKDL